MDEAGDQIEVTDAPAVPEPSWFRLDRRMIGAALVRMLLMVGPVAFTWVILGQRDSSVSGTFASLTAVAVIVPCFYILQYLRFRYRLTATELQIISGLFVRRIRRVPLHRIRTVDIVAKPVLRLFSLAIVTIGTGQQVSSGDSGLKLDAVRLQVAAALRDELLAASGMRGPIAAAPTEGLAQGLPDLLRIRWRWVIYSIVGVWSLVAPTALFGFAYQGLQFLGQNPDGIVGWYVSDYLTRVSPVQWLFTTVAVFLAIGAAGSTVIFIEAWWDYRLVYEERGRFVATRGLLTTRSLTVDQARLRGVTVAEALTTRMLGGARLIPILTGVSADQQNKETGLLVPTTTRDVPLELGNTLLGHVVLTDQRLGDGWLLRHPSAARRRILFRYESSPAIAAVLLGVAIALWHWPVWIEVIPLAAAVVLVPAAFGHYRGLGHRVEDGYLFSRRGYFLRRFDAIQLRGVSGATVDQTIFQRRLGLASVTATTASGEKAYHVVDVDIDEATRLAVILGGRSFV